jgi:hypothetical protein
MKSDELHQIVSPVSTAPESPHLLQWKENTTALENLQNHTRNHTKETSSHLDTTGIYVQPTKEQLAQAVEELDLNAYG